MKQEVTVQASPEFMLDLASKTIVAQAAEIERLRTALEQIAGHMSSEWPAMCIENVRTARTALENGND